MASNVKTKLSSKGNSRFEALIGKRNLLPSKRPTRISKLNSSGNLLASKRSQVTIYIIIGILIVAAVVLYLIFSGILTPGPVVPKQFIKVYDYFLSCIEDETRTDAAIMGMQGGYLELPEFEPGSSYMPFSSQLEFLGTAVPYWYYVSGNNIKKEQIPSKALMQQQLETDLKEKIMKCNFESFEQQGFNISFGAEPEVKAIIQDQKISLDISMPLTISYGDSSARKTEHSLDISSNLGKFYNIANKIYNKEKDSDFLENYTVDILRLYAPVDGSDIGCAPKLWFVKDIRSNLTSALEANIPAIKVKGDYYSLKDKNNKYFIQDIGDDIRGENVNFIYSGNWPTKLEVWPSEDNVLMAEPVGLEQGMGILGFCYVPYHFVYDLAYPVLIQVYDSDEIFEFPVAVVIDKNLPREAVNIQGLPDVVPELCEHKPTNMNIYTYNTELEPVEAKIDYKCFDTSCYIGMTQLDGGEAVLNEKFPQCKNGYIIASAEGYETKKQIASTISEDAVSIFLDKKYKLDIEVRKEGNGLSDDYAVVTFVKKDGKTTVVAYPEQQDLELTEGSYDIKVYVYSNATINLEGSQVEKCIDVPKSGILGFFGSSDKKCYTMEIPDQIVSSAVSGGGKQTYYFTQSELTESSKIVIDVTDFGIPQKVEDLQLNYNNLELNGLNIQLE